MQRKFSKLVPPLLKQIDRWLLLNKPGLWATRVHYVLFYGGIGLLGIMFYWLFKPIDLQAVDDPIIGTLLLIPISGIALLFWAWWSKAFVVEDHWGVANRGNALRDQLLYALVLVLLFLLPFSFSWLAYEKIKRAVDQETLVRDANLFNAGSYFYRLSPRQARQDVEILASSNKIDNLVTLSHGLSTASSYETFKTFQQTVTRGTGSELLKEYLRVARKYSPEKIPEPEQALALARKWREGNLHYSYSYGDHYEVRSNMQALHSAAHRQWEMTRDNALNGIGLGLGLLFLAILLFFQLGWKMFLGSIATFLGLLALSSLTVSLLHLTFNLGDSQTIAGLLSAGMFLGSIWYGTRKRGSRRGKIIQQIVLSQAVIITPFLFLLGTFWTPRYDPNQDVAMMLLWSGIGLAFVMWNLLYRPRFVQIVARPNDN